MIQIEILTIIKWATLALIVAGWRFWVYMEVKDDHGYIQGLGAILPTLAGLVAVIVWLVVFYVFL